MQHSAFGRRPLRLSCWTFASKTRRRYAAFGIMALHGPGRSLPRNASIDSHAKRDLDAASILLLVLRPVCSNRLGSRFESKRGALCSDRSGSICNQMHYFNEAGFKENVPLLTSPAYCVSAVRSWLERATTGWEAGFKN